MLALIGHYKASALKSVPLVASLVKDFVLKYLRKDNIHIHIVGFSLGAQIAGTAARLTSADPKGLKIQRVTGKSTSDLIYTEQMTSVLRITIFCIRTRPCRAYI